MFSEHYVFLGHWRKYLINIRIEQVPQIKGTIFSRFALIDREFVCQTCLGIEEDAAASSRLVHSSPLKLISFEPLQVYQPVN